MNMNAARACRAAVLVAMATSCSSTDVDTSTSKTGDDPTVDTNTDTDTTVDTDTPVDTACVTWEGKYLILDAEDVANAANVCEVTGRVIIVDTSLHLEGAICVSKFDNLLQIYWKECRN